MREIVLDTETTGLDPAQGHRLIEICCLELDNHLPTGRVFHSLINPERDIPEDSQRIHGLTEEKLRDAPVFAAVTSDLMAFVKDSPLVIHNSEFDLKFLNAEFARLNLEAWAVDRAIDTIALARRKFPGARYSLDELCRRFNIDLSARSKHGARIDAELLAEVYLELIGGRQAKLLLGAGDGMMTVTRLSSHGQKQRPEPLPVRLTPEEKEAHGRFVAGELSGDIVWNWGG